MSKFVKELLSKMTFAEKIGQMNQLSGDFFAGSDSEITGPLKQYHLSVKELYQTGSVLGVSGYDAVRKIQTDYLQYSRLKIPLLFMADVVHGYRTIFPIPLALAASFDPQLVKKTSDVLSREAAAGGLHVTFAPMVDLVRDPRWGRVMEANGEDPFLNEKLAAASVSGIQGEQKIPDKEHVAACVKHFAAYGAVEAGREYNTVDLSEWRLKDQYLSGYQAAIKAKAALVMSSFNTFQGRPASGNYHLMQDILRKELGFNGILISDWDAIGEQIAHGTAENLLDAAMQALKAGVDIDMMSLAYLKLAEKAQPSERVSRLVDQAVEQILNFKEALGLFTDPFRGLDPTAEKKEIFSSANQQLALQAAVDSMVLLKNDAQLLPLKTSQKIGLVGPKADTADLLGSWSWKGRAADTASFKTELEKTFSSTVCLHNEQLTAADLKLLQQQDVIIACVGLSSKQSGEATSLTKPQLPTAQLRLLQQLKQLHKPVITVLVTGRPLILKSVVESSDALLLVWFPGTKGAAALAEVLSGKQEPSGRLPMTFPRSVGQIPLYYDHYSTGRPLSGTKVDQKNKYLSKYIDESNDPQFCFGYGLGYAETRLERLEVDQSHYYSAKGQIKFIVTVRNCSDIPAKQVIQLYIHQKTAQTVRPVWQLKSFLKVSLDPLEEKAFELVLPVKCLAYVHSDLKKNVDAGNYLAKAGFDSQTGLMQSFKISQKELLTDENN